MSYIKINYNYFLDDEDVGSLISVKVMNYYYNVKEEIKNSLILSFKYENNVRPTHMTILKPDCSTKIIRLDYSSLDIEIKVLSSLRRKDEANIQLL